MWILGLLLLPLLIGFKGVAKLFIGIIVVYYLCMLFPSLIWLLVIGLFIHRILF